MNATVAPRLFVKPATARAALVLFIVSAAMPLLVHLLPSWDALPLGAHLLPMFWTAFVAVYLFDLRIGLLTAMGGPIASALLTTAPVWERLGSLTAELLVFVAVASWALGRKPRVWLIAPLSLITAKLISAIALAAFGATSVLSLSSLAVALPGFVVLLAINVLLVRKTDGSTARTES
jgi:hypothetical protein